jgi:hypothetical protein
MLFQGILNNEFIVKDPVSTDMSETTLKSATQSGTTNVYNVTGIGTLYDGMPITARFDTASTGAISIILNGGTTTYPVVDFTSTGYSNIAANSILSMRYNAVTSNFMSWVKGGDKSNPNLTGLVVTYANAHGQSTLALNPGFTSAGHAYTATLTSSIGTVNVTATAQYPNSKLSIAGTPITSGVTYPYIIGTGTSIEIDITQADGTVVTPYIITLTR